MITDEELKRACEDELRENPPSFLSAQVAVPGKIARMIDQVRTRLDRQEFYVFGDGDGSGVARRIKDEQR